MNTKFNFPGSYFFCFPPFFLTEQWKMWCRWQFNTDKHVGTKEGFEYGIIDANDESIRGLHFFDLAQSETFIPIYKFLCACICIKLFCRPRDVNWKRLLSMNFLCRVGGPLLSQTKVKHKMLLWCLATRSSIFGSRQIIWWIWLWGKWV